MVERNACGTNCVTVSCLHVLHTFNTYNYGTGVERKCNAVPYLKVLLNFLFRGIRSKEAQKNTQTSSSANHISVASFFS